MRSKACRCQFGLFLASRSSNGALFRYAILVTINYNDGKTKSTPMNTIRESIIANRPHRRYLPLFLAGFALCFLAASCRSYLGSDNLYKKETGEWKVIKKESGLDQKKGVILSARGNTSLRFQFLIHSYNMKVQEQSIYESTGKRHYYVNNITPWDEPFTVLILTPLVIPFDLIVSLLDYDYHYRGYNRPGLFYQIAYLPVIRYFFQPVLLSPNGLLLRTFWKDPPENDKISNMSSSDSDAFFKSHIGIEDVFNSPTRIEKRQQEVYSTAVSIDNSNSTVKITASDKSISKKVSPDGIMELDLSEIGPMAFDRQNTIKFKIHHEKWNMDWAVEAPATLDPEVIRDWNIFVDEQYDYGSRSFALTRLKPVLGEPAYRNYLKRLLDGEIDKRALPPMPTEIQIVPLQ